jgi:hypothetical protein
LSLTSFITQHPAVRQVKIRHIPHADFQEIVDIPRDKVTVQHLGHLRQRGFKGRKAFRL